MHKGSIATNQDILELIACPKIFKSAPKKATKVNKDVSQSFKVFRKTDDKEFIVFIAYSSRMPEDFSLGIRYDDMLLYRCNGFHGTTRAGFFTTPHHSYPHAHILTVSDIESGRAKKPSTIQDLTGKYINLQTAIVFFCEHCGILDYSRFFDVSQISFADLMKGGTV